MNDNFPSLTEYNPIRAIPTVPVADLEEAQRVMADAIPALARLMSRTLKNVGPQAFLTLCAAAFFDQAEQQKLAGHNRAAHVAHEAAVALTDMCSAYPHDAVPPRN